MSRHPISEFTQTWRGRPLVDRMAVIELIAATTAKAGLKVASALDTANYQKGIKVSNAEMKTLAIQCDAFHPEWSYTIRPRSAEFRSENRNTAKTGGAITPFTEQLAEANVLDNKHGGGLKPRLVSVNISYRGSVISVGARPRCASGMQPGRNEIRAETNAGSAKSGGKSRFSENGNSWA